jgi:toxin ParE1/3/4
MKVDFARRATADLRNISARTRTAFGDRVAEGLERRIREIIHHISLNPLGAPAVEGRPRRHALPLRRYPFVIFYRVLEDRVRILHIRHTSRRPWSGNDE